MTHSSRDGQDVPCDILMALTCFGSRGNNIYAEDRNMFKIAGGSLGSPPSLRCLLVSVAARVASPVPLRFDSAVGQAEYSYSSKVFELSVLARFERFTTR